MRERGKERKYLLDARHGFMEGKGKRGLVREIQLSDLQIRKNCGYEYRSLQALDL